MTDGLGGVGGGGDGSREIGRRQEDDSLTSGVVRRTDALARLDNALAGAETRKMLAQRAGNLPEEIAFQGVVISLRLARSRVNSHSAGGSSEGHIEDQAISEPIYQQALKDVRLAQKVLNSSSTALVAVGEGVVADGIGDLVQLDDLVLEHLVQWSPLDDIPAPVGGETRESVCRVATDVFRRLGLVSDSTREKFWFVEANYDESESLGRRMLFLPFRVPSRLVRFSKNIVNVGRDMQAAHALIKMKRQASSSVDSIEAALAAQQANDAALEGVVDSIQGSLLVGLVEQLSRSESGVGALVDNLVLLSVEPLCEFASRQFFPGLLVSTAKAFLKAAGFTSKFKGLLRPCIAEARVAVTNLIGKVDQLARGEKDGSTLEDLGVLLLRKGELPPEELITVKTLLDDCLSVKSESVGVDGDGVALYEQKNVDEVVTQLVQAYLEDLFLDALMNLVTQEVIAESMQRVSGSAGRLAGSVAAQGLLTSRVKQRIKTLLTVYSIGKMPAYVRVENGLTILRKLSDNRTPGDTVPLNIRHIVGFPREDSFLRPIQQLVVWKMTNGGVQDGLMAVAGWIRQEHIAQVTQALTIRSFDTMELCLGYLNEQGVTGMLQRSVKVIVGEVEETIDGAVMIANLTADSVASVTRVANRSIRSNNLFMNQVLRTGQGVTARSLEWIGKKVFKIGQAVREGADLEQIGGSGPVYSLGEMGEIIEGLRTENETLRQRLGESRSEEAIALLEGATDETSDLEGRLLQKEEEVEELQRAYQDAIDTLALYDIERDEEGEFFHDTVSEQPPEEDSVHGTVDESLRSDGDEGPSTSSPKV